MSQVAHEVDSDQSDEVTTIVVNELEPSLVKLTGGMSDGMDSPTPPPAQSSTGTTSKSNGDKKKIEKKLKKVGKTTTGGDPVKNIRLNYSKEKVKSDYSALDFANDAGNPHNDQHIDCTKNRITCDPYEDEVMKITSMIQIPKNWEVWLLSKNLLPIKRLLELGEDLYGSFFSDQEKFGLNDDDDDSDDGSSSLLRPKGSKSNQKQVNTEYRSTTPQKTPSMAMCVGYGRARSWDKDDRDVTALAAFWKNQANSWQQRL